MNLWRRSLTIALITLSCQFAFQPAGAVNSQAAAGDDDCSNIGPTMFSLGLGSSAVMLSVPACYSLDADNTDDARFVRVPIEGSLMVLDETPAFVVATEHDLAVGSDASATSDEPNLVRGQPSQIGPTI